MIQLPECPNGCCSCCQNDHDENLPQEVRSQAVIAMDISPQLLALLDEGLTSQSMLSLQPSKESTTRSVTHLWIEEK